MLEELINTKQYINIGLNSVFNEYIIFDIVKLSMTCNIVALN